MFGDGTIEGWWDKSNWQRPIEDADDCHFRNAFIEEEGPPWATNKYLERPYLRYVCEDGPLPDHDEHGEPRCWKQPPDPGIVYEGTVTEGGRYVKFDEDENSEIRSVNDRRPIPVCVQETVGRANPGRVRFKVVQISTGPAADILVE